MIDKLFHYYGTYIAARFAGMEQTLAQRLAFTQLPCLSAAGVKGNFITPLEYDSSVNFCETQQQRLPNSPLADANRSIGRKIVSKLARFRRQSAYKNETVYFAKDFDPRIRNIANSEFSRKMLNYGIKQKNHSSDY